jgi:hypothetical protein
MRNGIVKNTGRIEPLFFFPMGIYRVGSMRQRGHHAANSLAASISMIRIFLTKNISCSL